MKFEHLHKFSYFFNAKLLPLLCNPSCVQYYFCQSKLRGQLVPPMEAAGQRTPSLAARFLARVTAGSMLVLIPARAWVTLVTPSWAARFLVRVTLATSSLTCW